MPKILVLVALLLFAGSIIFYQNLSQVNLSNSPSPSPSVSASPSESPTSTPVSSKKPAVSTSPRSSVMSQSDSFSNEYISIQTKCAGDHDGLGNHIDATVKFSNLEKLNSQDLIIGTIDTATLSRSESHIKTNLVNNQTLTFHKFVTAVQGSTVPLEIVPGKYYVVKIKKATYESDGTIDVYVDATELNFSQRCSF